MLAEFVSKIAELAVGKKQVEAVEVPELRKIIVRKGDEYSDEEIPPDFRSADLTSLDDFCRYVTDPRIPVDPNMVEIFHSPERIVAYLDGARREDMAQMTLRHSAEWMAIERLLPRSAPPVELLKFLRKNFNAVPQEVRDSLSRIDFTRTSSGRTSVEHGRESLGRSVEASVQQADKIPESFKVTVPMYDNPGLRGIRVTVQIGIYLHSTEEQVEFFALPGEIDAAVNQVHEEIGKRLAAGAPDAQVFHGSQ